MFRHHHPILRGSRLRSSCLTLLAGALFLVFTSPDGAWAQQSPFADLVVRVENPYGEVAAGAEVRLVDHRRSITVGPDGVARFRDVPAGSVLVEAISPAWGRAIERVEVVDGAEHEVTLVLTRLYQGEEIVVSVGPGALRRSELARVTDVVGGRELATTVRSTLGETLEGRPGLSATYFGPGASRPVIRGLGGDRVRVLESGVGAGDAAATSPDHAVSTEPLAADRIEILRGPATLLYGSSAVGGVVNVVDGRIPREPADRLVTGSIRGLGGTVSDELTGAITIEGGTGAVAWHLSGLRRETDDYGIPGSAVIEEEHADAGEEGEAHEDEEPGEEPFGVLPNSFVETTRGAVGLSYVGETGYLGVAFSGYDKLYGVPGGHEHAHEEEDPHAAEEEPGAGEEDEEVVQIDVQQRRIDLESAWRFDSRLLNGLKVRLGVADYRHFELEGPEIGTRFTNDEWEGRVELHHRLGGGTGTLGLQVGSRDFAAVGEEAFVPPSETDRIGVFLFEDLGEGPLRYQLGARYERQDVAADLAAAPALDHEGLSLSAGLVWQPEERIGLALSLSRSTKLPTAEELFSNGPHLATRSFEVGNPDLGEEVALGGDLSLRLLGGPMTGELTGFVTRFDDFIFQSFTDEEEDDLPVLVYDQADALFVGYEAKAAYHFLEEGGADLELGVWSDYVRAELVEEDAPLPRIPPLRIGARLGYLDAAWMGSLGVRRVFEQDRTAAFESPTEGYTMLDASLGYSFTVGRFVHGLTLSAANLGDEEARSHVSFLKEVAPLPGREVRLSYRVAF